MISWLKSITRIEQIVVVSLVVLVFSVFCFVLFMLSGGVVAPALTLSTPLTELTVGQLIVILFVMGMLTK